MILDEVLDELGAHGDLDGRAVRGVYPTGYFAVIELDDGDVGAGMSYFRCPAAEAEILRLRIEHIRASDPLLLRWLFEDPEPWTRIGRDGDDGRMLIWCLRTALLSALSARRIRAGGGGAFVSTQTFPRKHFEKFRRAVVIGFGGYMSSFAKSEFVTDLHVCDLSYAGRRAEMEEFADHYRRRRPGLRFTFSDGRDVGPRMREADVVTITGSTLCNGTLEGLLELAQGGPEVVVQGESAGVIPGPLFRRGVGMTATTIKPPALARLAAADPSGDSLRPLLEGGIPWTYLHPPGRGEYSPGRPGGVSERRGAVTGGSPPEAECSESQSPI